MFHTTRKYNHAACGMRRHAMRHGSWHDIKKKNKFSSHTATKTRDCGFIGFCASLCWHLSSDEKPQFPRPKCKEMRQKNIESISKTSNFKLHFFRLYTLNTTRFLFHCSPERKRPLGKMSFSPFWKGHVFPNQLEIFGGPTRPWTYVPKRPRLVPAPSSREMPFFLTPKNWLNWPPVNPKLEGSRYGCIYLHLFISFYQKKSNPNLGKYTSPMDRSYGGIVFILLFSLSIPLLGNPKRRQPCSGSSRLCFQSDQVFVGRGDTMETTHSITRSPKKEVQKVR